MKTTDARKKEFKQVLRKTYKESSKVSWMLIKVYVPLSIITIILKEIGVIDAIAPFFAPIMELMGLPGETGITLIAGSVNNVFAAVATMSAFDLTFRQITILGIVVGISHNLIIETGILTKLKMATPRIALFRMVMAVIMGIVMNAILPKEISGMVINPYAQVHEFSWIAVFQSVTVTSIQIIVVIFLLTLGYELVMIWKHTEGLKKKLGVIPKSIGFSENALGPFLAGAFIGIAYGAGILYHFVRDGKLSHKDTGLTTVFLVLAHALIEDTMLFVVVGGNFWWIFLTRTILGMIVIRFLSTRDNYKRFLWIGLPKERVVPSK